MPESHRTSLVQPIGPQASHYDKNKIRRGFLSRPGRRCVPLSLRTEQRCDQSALIASKQTWPWPCEKKYRVTRLSAASPGNLQKCSAKRDKFRTYPRLTLFVCLSSLFWLTHGKPSGFVHAPPPSQVSPVTGSRHRGTHACAYSTGCQLRTLTGFPYPRACTFRQTEHGEITNNSIFLYYTMPFSICNSFFSRKAHHQSACVPSAYTGTSPHH